MVDMKKPAKPVPDTTAAKPAATTTNRPSLPALSPLPGTKSAAADVQPVAPAAVSTAPVEATKPASAPAEPTAAPTPAKAAKPSETLAPKLRAKSEIISALRAGSHVQHTEAGLYRVVEVSGTVHPASKRRILALIEQGVLKPTESDKRKYVLDAEADKKAHEPKPPASAPAPDKSEPSTSAKPEGK